MLTDNLGTDLEEMWNVYTKGVMYSSEFYTEAIGKLRVPLGEVCVSILSCLFSLEVVCVCR